MKEFHHHHHHYHQLSLLIIFVTSPACKVVVVLGLSSIPFFPVTLVSRNAHCAAYQRIDVHLITCVSGHITVFNWVSKVISELLWFFITSLSDWFKVLATLFNQSEVKPKPIACTFSRALCRLRVITSSFDWCTGLSSSFLIGQSNCFGFGFRALDWNSLYLSR